MEHLQLYTELKKRGRKWGDENAERIRAMRADSRPVPPDDLRGEKALPDIPDEDETLWEHVEDVIQNRVSRDRPVLIRLK